MKREDFPAGEVTDVVVKREVLEPTPAPVAKDCALVVTPHPMTVQGQRVLSSQEAALVPGETLAVFLERHGVVVGRQWVVSLGGMEVQEIHWERIRPKPGHLIEARRVPEGGGGGDLLRLVATMALMVAAAPVAGYLAGAMNITSAFGIGLIQAGVMLAGSMVINKMLPPKLPEIAGNQGRIGAASSPTYSISGGRNRARQFENMPLVLGQPYCVPDLAAQPYTYFANGEQHLWQLFHAGLNCAAVDTIKIGQTPVGNYLGVSLSYAGFSSGNTGLPLLSNVDSVAGALLDAPSGSGPLVVRTSSVNAIQLAVDIEGNLYSVNNTNGAYENLSCDITLEYRLVGSGTWLPFLDSGATITLNSASTKPLRLTYTRQVAAGQYEVQARKVTANVTASNQQNSIQWSTLKTYQVDNGSYKGEARFGIQVQASGQLNGSLDEVNCMGTAKPMPYWNGTAWVTATSRANGLSNPGAQILLLARGIYDEDGRLLAGLGLPDSQIDIESLKLFMVWCAAKGFTFDYFLQETMSIGDLIDAIAAVGMGEKSYHTGRLGVIWFSDDQPVESVLNMGTIKAKSFSVDYDTQATADELEFQYFDRNRNNTWKSIRVLAPGVTTPVATARHPLTGVTTEAHAAVLARFHMAQNVYQRKTVNCEVDLEHLTFRRGTVIALSHDMTQWGYGGRVKAAVNSGGTVTLTLDDVVPAVGPGGASSRYMGLRIPGESQYRVFPVQAFSGSSRTVTLASTWPSGVPVPGDSADNPAWDTVWIYDFKSTPGQKLRVTQIVPNGNMGGAKVALVPEGAEFWSYVWTGAYTPPPNNSLLQGAPVVKSAKVTEQLLRQGQAYYTELTLTYDVAGNFDRAELWGAMNGGVLQRLGSTKSQSMSWRGGLRETWALELRTFSALRLGTPYQISYTVVGLDANPETPQGLALTQDSVFCRPTPFAVDVIGFLVRSTPGVVAATMADFLRGSEAHKGYVQAFPWKFTTRLYGVQTVMVVSEDSSGNWSDVAYASLDFGQPSDQNIGQIFDYRAAAWPGTHADCSIVAGDLLSDVNPASDLNSLLDWNGEPDLNATQLLPLIFEAQPFVPLYGGGTLVLDVATEGPQRAIDYRINGSTTFDLNTLADWNVEADLNGGSSGWSQWPGALQVDRGISYSIRVSIAGGTEQPKLVTFMARLALQKATQTFPPMAISAAGTRLAPAVGEPPVTWVNVQSVTMLPEADGSGAVGGRFLDLSPTLGPLVQQVNSSGVPVDSRSIPTVWGLIDV